MKKNFLAFISFLMILCSCGNGNNKSYMDGYDDGYKDGHEHGTSEGYADGSEDGYSDGYSDGYGDGYDDGVAAGGSNDDGSFDDGYSANEPYYSIHTAEQADFLNGDYNTLPSSINGKEEKSIPKPVNISINPSSKIDRTQLRYYKLILADNKDFNNAITFESNGKANTFELYNLNIRTRYFYKYEAVLQNSTYKSEEVKTFFVENQAPRNIYLDGVTNCRDVGGWSYGNGYTAQNILYRTAKLHDDSRAYISSEGITEAKRLGIKTEIDLRDTDQDYLHTYSSAIDGVKYYHFGVDSEKSYFTHQANIESFRKTFKILTDESNYPVIFHCAIGTDRTGFVAYCLNALAGVGIEDMTRDYLFSCYGNINGLRQASTITGYKDYFKNTYNTGDNLIEGAKAYLKDIGLTDGEINHLQANIRGEVDHTTHHKSANWQVCSIDPRRHIKICTDANCGLVLEQEDHKYGDLQITTPPTAIEDGEGFKVCEICSYRKDEIIPHESTSCKVINMKDYGTNRSFTVYVNTNDVDVLNNEASDIKLYKDGTLYSGASISYKPNAVAEEYSELTITLPTTPNKGEVFTIGKQSIISDGNTNYLIENNYNITYDGTGYFPSFYKGTWNCRMSTSTPGRMYFEADADFTDFLGGQAADGVMPYYTSTSKNKLSHFVYTIKRGETTITITNDNLDGGSVQTKTLMFWEAAKILRIELSVSMFVDGDIFTITKGSAYADNGGHAGHTNTTKKYILEQDIVCKFDASAGKLVAL